MKRQLHINKQFVKTDGVWTFMCPWIIFMVLLVYFLLRLTIKLFHANLTIYNKAHFNQFEPFIVVKKTHHKFSRPAWRSSLLISYFINSQSLRMCVTHCSLQVWKFLLHQFSLPLTSHILSHTLSSHSHHVTKPHVIGFSQLVAIFVLRTPKKPPSLL